MSIILETASGKNLRLNAWNWGVLHHLAAVAAIFPEELWDPQRGGGGDELSLAEVRLLADFLEQEVLPCLKEGERMFFNGTVTDLPDDGTFYRDESELWRNYSLRHDVLVRVVAFLRTADGPVRIS
jgi:hypothetical protein